MKFTPEEKQFLLKLLQETQYGGTLAQIDLVTQMAKNLVNKLEQKDEECLSELPQ